MGEYKLNKAGLRKSQVNKSENDDSPIRQLPVAKPGTVDYEVAKLATERIRQLYESAGPLSETDIEGIVNEVLQEQGLDLDQDMRGNVNELIRSATSIPPPMEFEGSLNSAQEDIGKLDEFRDRYIKRSAPDGTEEEIDLTDEEIAETLASYQRIRQAVMEFAPDLATKFPENPDADSVRRVATRRRMRKEEKRLPYKANRGKVEKVPLTPENMKRINWDMRVVEADGTPIGAAHKDVAREVKEHNKEFLTRAAKPRKRTRRDFDPYEQVVNIYSDPMFDDWKRWKTHQRIKAIEESLGHMGVPWDKRDSQKQMRALSRITDYHFPNRKKLTDEEAMTILDQEVSDILDHYNGPSIDKPRKGGHVGLQNDPVANEERKKYLTRAEKLFDEEIKKDRDDEDARYLESVEALHNLLGPTKQRTPEEWDKIVMELGDIPDPEEFSLAWRDLTQNWTTPEKNELSNRMHEAFPNYHPQSGVGNEKEPLVGSYTQDDPSAKASRERYLTRAPIPDVDDPWEPAEYFNPDKPELDATHLRIKIPYFDAETGKEYPEGTVGELVGHETNLETGEEVYDMSVDDPTNEFGQITVRATDALPIRRRRADDKGPYLRPTRKAPIPDVDDRPAKRARKPKDPHSLVRAQAASHGVPQDVVDDVLREYNQPKGKETGEWEDVKEGRDKIDEREFLEGGFVGGAEFPTDQAGWDNLIDLIGNTPEDRRHQLFNAMTRDWDRNEKLELANQLDAEFSYPDLERPDELPLSGFVETPPDEADLPTTNQFRRRFVTRAHDIDVDDDKPKVDKEKLRQFRDDLMRSIREGTDMRTGKPAQARVMVSSRLDEGVTPPADEESYPRPREGHKMRNPREVGRTPVNAARGAYEFNRRYNTKSDEETLPSGVPFTTYQSAYDKILRQLHRDGVEDISEMVSDPYDDQLYNMFTEALGGKELNEDYHNMRVWEMVQDDLDDIWNKNKPKVEGPDVIPVREVFKPGETPKSYSDPTKQVNQYRKRNVIKSRRNWDFNPMNWKLNITQKGSARGFYCGNREKHPAHPWKEYDNQLRVKRQEWCLGNDYAKKAKKPIKVKVPEQDDPLAPVQRPAVDDRPPLSRYFDSPDARVQLHTHPSRPPVGGSDWSDERIRQLIHPATFEGQEASEGINIDEDPAFRMSDQYYVHIDGEEDLLTRIEENIETEFPDMPEEAKVRAMKFLVDDWIEHSEDSGFDPVRLRQLYYGK